MYAMKIPPYAIKMDAGFNLMKTDQPSSPDYCWPLLRYPDPQPIDAYTNYWTKTGGPGTVTKTNYRAWSIGDPTPQPESVGKSWFRVFRDGPSTFIITCGSGGTQGFKSWSEIPTAMRYVFSNDESYFLSLQQSELRLHYRIEWTAAVTETTYHNLQHEFGRNTEHYETWAPNSSHSWSSSRRTQTWLKNPVGTIRWIQRLLQEPTHW
jgi:hypothetical protein